MLFVKKSMNIVWHVVDITSKPQDIIHSKNL